VLALPWYLWKGRGSGKYLRSFRERMGRLPQPLRDDGRRSVWIHAVSVGEVLAARILVGPLKRRLPQHRIVVSTTTVTGQAVARRSLGDADALFYAPFDWVGPVRQALDAVRPDLLLLVETELWPNLIHQARRGGVRVAVVNGRISAASFRRYRRIRFFMKRVLAEVDLLAMQEPSHVHRILEMGARPERVQPLGNLKFDALEPPRTPEALERLLSGVAACPLLVAGSTMEGEEPLVLEAFRRLRASEPRARMVLAPRHPERFAAAAELVEAAGLACARRSALAEVPWGDEEVLLLDTLGELASLYPLATVVFVGGSLVATGGHNVLEPAAAGRAVVVGPHMENFQEIADQFRDAGALVQVSDAEQLGSELIALASDAERRRRIGNSGQALVESSRGALDRTLEALEPLMP
jgi:3-deoxy-D-manno-octulosonic-acid transferase